MKKIIGSILLVIPLACNNSVHTEDTGQVQHTADTTVATVVSAEPVGFTGTGKVKAADYADIYFRSQDLIAHVYVKTGQKVRKGEKLADLETFSLDTQLKEAEISLEQSELELKDILIGIETDSAQKGCYRQLLLTIDVCVHDIVDVSSELNPRALEWDNTC